MRFYGDIQRVDEEQRMVWGYASTEARARDGLTITRAAMEGALDGYMAFANIREMHQKSAVGRADEAHVDDGGLYIGAKIVDDAAWDKVVQRVYKGFSIGAKITERDPADKMIVRGVDIYEISLVDRPSDPGAVFDVFRADGADEETDDMARAKAKAAGAAADTAIEGEVLARADDAAGAAAAGAGEAEAAGDAEVVEVVGDAAVEAAAPADPVARAEAAMAGLTAAVETAERVYVGAEPLPPIIIALNARDDVQRGLYDVSRLGELLTGLASIIFSATWEAESEGDNSPVPAKLRDGLKVLADGFRAMAEEEVRELLASIEVARSATAIAGDLITRADGMADEEREEVVRLLAGSPLVAKPPTPDEEITRLGEANTALTGTVERMAQQVEEMSARIERLGAEPLPPKTAGSTVVRVVDKVEDATGLVTPNAPALSSDDVKRALDAMSPDDRADMLVRAALKQPQAITR